MRSVMLEFSEGTSDKFWQGNAEGCQFKACYGRKGTDGQTKEWSFATADEALAQLDKVVKEKLRKGYQTIADISYATSKDKDSANEHTTAGDTSKAIVNSNPNKATLAGDAALTGAAARKTKNAAVEVKLSEIERLYNFHNRKKPFPWPSNGVLSKEDGLALFINKDYNSGRQDNLVNAQQWLEYFRTTRLWSPHEAHFWFVASCLYRQAANKFGNSNFLQGDTSSDLFMRESFTRPLEAIEISGKLTTIEARTLIANIGENSALKMFASRGLGQLNPERLRRDNFDLLIPLLQLLPFDECLTLWQELWQITPSGAVNLNEKADIDMIIQAIRCLVVPYISDQDLERLQEYLKKEIKRHNWRAQEPHEEIPLCYLIAGLFGLHDQLLPVIESIPDGFYANQVHFGGLVHPQILLGGLNSPALVKKHFERLKLRLAFTGDCITWFAHMGAHEIEPVARFTSEYGTPYTQAKYSWNRAELFLEPLLKAHSAEAAAAIFEMSQVPAFRAQCMKWFDKNTQLTFEGLTSIIDGKGELATKAQIYSRDLILRVDRDTLSEEAEKRFDELKQRSEEEHMKLARAGRPEWLEKIFLAHKLKMTALPIWLTGVGHDPTVIDGYCLSNEEQVQIMLAIKSSSADQIHPLLLALRESTERGFFDAFLWGVFERWLLEQAPTKEKWCMLGIGILASEKTVFKLLPLMKEWRGSGNSARAGYGLECIKAAGTDGSLMLIHRVSQSASLKSLRNRAQIIIAEIAKMRNLSPAQLEDRIVPTCGLDEKGNRTFDFGNRQFQFVLGSDLKAYVKDASGKVKADLPAANKDDDQDKAATALVAWKDLKKQIRAVAQAQSKRLELAMISGRRWSAEEFVSLFVKHPLLWHICKPIIWAVYSEDGKVVSTFRITEERDFSDSLEKTYALPMTATVGIAHALELEATTLAAWGQILTDYELAAPFAQIGRAINKPSDEELKSNRFEQIMSVEIEAVYVPSVLESRDWERWQVVDGGAYYGHNKYFPGKDITASISYTGIYSGDPRMSEMQKIEAIHFFKGHELSDGYNFRYYNAANQTVGLDFTEVDQVVMAEVYTDLSVLASKAKDAR